MLNPRTQTLFHFTKTLSHLKSILQNGFYPSFCLEDLIWIDQKEEQLAYAMTCFCDIPLARIFEHTKFYGSFGIGLSKKWGMRSGLDPILYCHESGKTTAAIKALIEEVRLQQSPPESPIRQNLNRLLTMTKPLRGKMIIEGKSKEKEFHQENEWRYVPDPNSAILQRGYLELKEKRNEEFKKYALKFSSDDIKYIFLNSEDEIPEIVDFIHSDLGLEKENDSKVLASKIVSLSSIKHDL